MSDNEYDILSKTIHPKQKTGNRKLDKFFREEFDPSTGMWILKHPELDVIAKLFNKYYLPLAQ